MQYSYRNEGLFESIFSYFSSPFAKVSTYHIEWLYITGFIMYVTGLIMIMLLINVSFISENFKMDPDHGTHKLPLFCLFKISLK